MTSQVADNLLDVNDIRLALQTGNSELQRNVLNLLKCIFNPGEYTFVIPSIHGYNLTPQRQRVEVTMPRIPRDLIVMVRQFGVSPIELYVVYKPSDTALVPSIAAPGGVPAVLRFYEETPVLETGFAPSKEPNLAASYWNGTSMSSVTRIHSRQTTMNKSSTQGRFTAGTVTDSRNKKSLTATVLQAASPLPKDTITGTIYDGAVTIQGPRWSADRPIDYAYVAGNGDAAILSLLDEGLLTGPLQFTNPRAVLGWNTQDGGMPFTFKHTNHAALTQVLPGALLSPNVQTLLATTTLLGSASTPNTIWNQAVYISDTNFLVQGNGITPLTQNIRLPSTLSVQTFPSFEVKCRVPATFGNMNWTPNGATGNSVGWSGCWSIKYSTLYKRCVTDESGNSQIEVIAEGRTIAIPVQQCDLTKPIDAIPTMTYADSINTQFANTRWLGQNAYVTVTIPSLPKLGYEWAGIVIQGEDDSMWETGTSGGVPDCPLEEAPTKLMGVPVFRNDDALSAAFGRFTPWFCQPAATRVNYQPVIEDIVVIAPRQYDANRNQMQVVRVYGVGEDQTVTIESTFVAAVVANTDTSMLVGSTSNTDYNIFGKDAVDVVQALWYTPYTPFSNVYFDGRGGSQLTGQQDKSVRTYEEMRQLVGGLTSTADLLALPGIMSPQVQGVLKSSGFFGDIANALQGAASTVFDGIKKVAPLAIEYGPQIASMMTEGQWGAAGQWGADQVGSNASFSGRSNGGYTCSDVANAPGEPDDELLASGGMWGAGEDVDDDDEPSARAAFGADMLSGGRFRLYGKGGDQAGFLPGTFFSMLQLINLFDMWFRKKIIKEPVQLHSIEGFPMMMLNTDDIADTFESAAHYFGTMAMDPKSKFGEELITTRNHDIPTGNEGSQIEWATSPAQFSKLMADAYQSGYYVGSQKAQEQALEVAGRIFQKKDYNPNTPYFEAALEPDPRTSKPRFQISGNILKRTKALACTVFYCVAPLCLLPMVKRGSKMPIYRVPILIRDIAAAKQFVVKTRTTEFYASEKARLASARNDHAYNRWAFGGHVTPVRPPNLGPGQPVISASEWQAILDKKRATLRRNAGLVRPREVKVKTEDSSL